jgi:hypothetical protein
MIAQQLEHQVQLQEDIMLEVVEEHIMLEQVEQVELEVVEVDQEELNVEQLTLEEVVEQVGRHHLVELLEVQESLL